jgi:hypothetical protein
MSLKQLKKYLRKILRTKHSKTERYLSHELRRKDAIIKELHDKNKLLLRTTIKQSNEILDLKRQIQEWANR